MVVGSLYCRTVCLLSMEISMATANEILLGAVNELRQEVAELKEQLSQATRKLKRPSAAPGQIWSLRDDDSESYYISTRVGGGLMYVDLKNGCLHDIRHDGPVKFEYVGLAEDVLSIL